MAFPPTRISLLDAARHNDNTVAREAMGRLLEIYRQPLTDYLIRSGTMSKDEAEDIFHGFIADKILEKGLMDRFRSEVGRFRSFLLTSLRNYANDQHRKRRDKVSNDDIFDASSVPPIEAFEIEFASKVASEVLSRMEAWYKNRGREDVWQLFYDLSVLPVISTDEPPKYDDVIQKLGFESSQGAYNTLANAKRTAARVLRDVVGEYEGMDIDDEILQLRAILDKAQLGLGRFLSGIQNDQVENKLNITPPGMTKTITQLLSNRDTDIATLKSLKDYTASLSDESMPRETREIVYYGAIAAVLIQYNQKITSLGNGNLKNGFNLILQNPGLPVFLKDLFKTAIEHLGP